MHFNCSVTITVNHPGTVSQYELLLIVYNKCSVSKICCIIVGSTVLLPGLHKPYRISLNNLFVPDGFKSLKDRHE